METEFLHLRSGDIKWKLKINPIYYERWKCLIAELSHYHLNMWYETTTNTATETRPAVYQQSQRRLCTLKGIEDGEHKLVRGTKTIQKWHNKTLNGTVVGKIIVDLFI